MFYGLLSKFKDRKFKLALLTVMYAVLFGIILLLLIFFGSTKKQMDFINKYIENEVTIMPLGDPLYEDTINEILKVDCIQEYNVMSETGVRLKDCAPVIKNAELYKTYLKETEENAKNLWKQEYNPENLAQVSIIETNSTQNNTYFLNKGFQIIEGEDLNRKDTNAALISSEFAEKNKLHVGDVFETEPCANDYYYAKILKMKLKVKGLFTHNSRNFQGKPSLYESNYIFTPIGPISQTFKTSYERMTVYLKKGYSIEDLKGKIKDKSLYLDINNYAFNSSREWGDIVSEPLNNMQKMSGFLLVLMLACIVIIIILLGAFYIKGNSHNIGVLLSIGVGKKKVIFQMLIEEIVPLLLGALLALCVGTGSMGLIAQAVDSRYTSEIEKIASEKNEELLDGRPEMQATVNELRTVGQVMRVETDFKAEYTLNGMTLIIFAGIVCILLPCCIVIQTVYKMKHYSIKAILLS